MLNRSTNDYCHRHHQQLKEDISKVTEPLDVLAEPLDRESSGDEADDRNRGITVQMRGDGQSVGMTIYKDGGKEVEQPCERKSQICRYD